MATVTAGCGLCNHLVLRVSPQKAPKIFLRMATIDGLPISVRENLLMQEVALIFELSVKNNILGNDIRKLERETGLSDYKGLKALRERLENRLEVCGWTLK